MTPALLLRDAKERAYGLWAEASTFGTAAEAGAAWAAYEAAREDWSVHMCKAITF